MSMSGPMTSGLPSSVAVNFGSATFPPTRPAGFFLPMGSPLPRWRRPDAKQPDTLGWRAWIFTHGRFLMSPYQGTLWKADRLLAAEWSDNDVVLGFAGIHARLVPKHWKLFGWPDDEGSFGLDDNPLLVTGIVERFGRYVMGTEGWRAEQVVIRELMAPSTEVGLQLEECYPDVIVHYPDQGEESCVSVKSLELEKGSRSLLPLTQPSPSPAPPPAALVWNPLLPPRPPAIQLVSLSASESQPRWWLGKILFLACSSGLIWLFFLLVRVFS